MLIGGANPIMMVLLLVGEALGLIGIAASAEYAVRERSCLGCLVAGLFAYVFLIVYGWTKFCLLLLNGSSRANEFAADKYAFELGYGDELAEALDQLTLGVPATTFLKALNDTHPDPDERIGRLQSYGSDYRRL
jgi:heat shock protein HtpX